MSDSRRSTSSCLVYCQMWANLVLAACSFPALTRSAQNFSCGLFGWLADWLVGWLVGWLAGWLAG